MQPARSMYGLVDRVYIAEFGSARNRKGKISRESPPFPPCTGSERPEAPAVGPRIDRASSSRQKRICRRSTGATHHARPFVGVLQKSNSKSLR